MTEILYRIEWDILRKNGSVKETQRHVDFSAESDEAAVKRVSRIIGPPIDFKKRSGYRVIRYDITITKIASIDFL